MSNTSDSNKDFADDDWTIERVLDELFVCLAGKREVIPDKRKDSILIYYRKYYHQARKLFKWIPIAKPPPEFVVNISDFTIRIVAELKVILYDEENKDDSTYALKQAVGRIFENIDFRQYHLSIARNLEVVLKP
jgi:hypothetical protein